MNFRNARVRLISFALILILLLLCFNSDTASILIAGDEEALQNLSNGSIVILILFTLLLMIIQNIFPVIPLLLLISVNASIFGFTIGYLWSFLISIVGAIVSFMISRYWFQTFFDKYVNNSIKLKVEERGFWYVFIGRVFPIMPTSVINIASGVSSIGFKKFLYATILGNTVYFMILTLITKGVLSIQLESYIYMTLVGVLLAAYIMIKIWKRKHMNNRKLRSK